MKQKKILRWLIANFIVIFIVINICACAKNKTSGSLGGFKCENKYQEIELNMPQTVNSILGLNVLENGSVRIVGTDKEHSTAELWEYSSSESSWRLIQDLGSLFLGMDAGHFASAAISKSDDTVILGYLTDDDEAQKSNFYIWDQTQGAVQPINITDSELINYVGFSGDSYYSTDYTGKITKYDKKTYSKIKEIKLTDVLSVCVNNNDIFTFGADGVKNYQWESEKENKQVSKKWTNIIEVYNLDKTRIIADIAEDETGVICDGKGVYFFDGENLDYLIENSRVVLGDSRYTVTAMDYNDRSNLFFLLQGDEGSK